LVLDCEAINFVDSQGSAKIAEIAGLANESHASAVRVKPAAGATFDSDVVLERIRTENIHGNVQRRSGAPGTRRSPSPAN
jgi:sulfate permease, SulP family